MSKLHPQAAELLAAAGVTVEPHRSEPGLWIYTLPTGQQGGGESEQRAAARALDHMRAALGDLAGLVEVLEGEIATLRQQVKAAGGEAQRLAEGEQG